MGKQNEGVKTNETIVDKSQWVLKARGERSARIKAIREGSGLTTAEFAVQCGVTEVTQYHYEKGTRSPDADYLDLLFFARAVDIGELVTGVPKGLRTGYDAQTRGMADRIQALPTKLRKPVGVVLELAWDVHKAATIAPPEPPPAKPKPARKKA